MLNESTKAADFFTLWGFFPSKKNDIHKIEASL